MDELMLQECTEAVYFKKWQERNESIKNIWINGGKVRYAKGMV